MLTNKNDVLNQIMNQIEEVQVKKQIEKMKDLEIGKELAAQA